MERCPHRDSDISAAIAALQSSTAAIEKQFQILETQREALVSLKALNKPNISVEHMRNDRRRHEIQEKGRLDIAVSTRFHVMEISLICARWKKC